MYPTKIAHPTTIPCARYFVLDNTIYTYIYARHMMAFSGWQAYSGVICTHFRGSVGPSIRHRSSCHPTNGPVRASRPLAWDVPRISPWEQPHVITCHRRNIYLH